MFFKIVRNFKAKIGPFLLTLFLAPGYVHANMWEINVTRKIVIYIKLLGRILLLILNIVMFMLILKTHISGLMAMIKNNFYR